MKEMSNKQKKIFTNLGGYKLGKDGLFVDSKGNKLSFELIVPAGWTDWIAVSQVLSSQLKQIGIDALVSQVDFGLYLERIKNKDFELAVSWVNYGINPYLFYERWLHSRNAFSGDNRGGWNSITTDSLLDIFRKTSDERERQLAISSLQLIGLQEIPSVPLFFLIPHGLNIKHIILWDGLMLKILMLYQLLLEWTKLL